MTTDQLDVAARMILDAMVANDFDSAHAVSQAVGDNPRDLAAFVVAMAGVAADALQRHRAPDDPRASRGYL